MQPAQIKALRLSLNLTQAEFANALETSPPAIASWEAGTRNPKPKAVARMQQLTQQLTQPTTPAAIMQQCKQMLAKAYNVKIENVRISIDF